MITTNDNIIVIHSGESKTFVYNPLTHEEVRNETADGNVIITVQPRVEQSRAATN